MKTNRNEGGELLLEKSIRLYPGLSEREFASAVQEAGWPIEMRGIGSGYRWHSVPNVRFAEDRRTFSLSAGFREERLFQAMLALNSPAYGSSWEDWTESQELRRKSDHDRFLADRFGREPDRTRSRPYPSVTYIYPWGTVFSSYDPRSASSTILVDWQYP